MKVSIKGMRVTRLSLGNDIPPGNRIIEVERASMVEPHDGKWKVYKMDNELRRALSEMLEKAEVIYVGDSREECIDWELKNII